MARGGEAFTIAGMYEKTFVLTPRLRVLSLLIAGGLTLLAGCTPTAGLRLLQPQLAGRQQSVQLNSDWARKIATIKRFASFAGRTEHRDELEQVMTQWCRSRTQAEVIDAFTAAEAAIGPVYDMADIAMDPHYAARGAIADVGAVIDQTLNLLKPHRVFAGIQAAVRVASELLGVMMVVTDMHGRPVTDVANPSRWYSAHDRSKSRRSQPTRSVR